ncbi:response regulator [Candidatus Dependentiae bacterium]|nr:response regulator [Candidatus Dependentiae bacterium]
MDKLKVLIADDSPIIRFELIDVLEEIGCEIVGEAENGVQAVELFKQFDPAVVTLDIIMPEKDGITALKEILQIKPTTKVIMVTAMGSKQTLFECIKAGAFDFIEKPFVKEKVVQTFQKVQKVLTTTP